MNSNSQEVKEIFLQTSRRGRVGQMGWRGVVARWSLEDWMGEAVKMDDRMVPHFRVDKLGGKTGEQHRLQNPVFQFGGKKASKPLTAKTCGIGAAEETLSLTGDFAGETHRALEHTKTHPPGNQHQKSIICLWVVVEVTESWQRAQQVTLFLLRPLPHMECHNAAMQVALPWPILKDPPLTM